MSREKENKSIQDKFKQIFKLNRTSPGAVAANRDFIITNDILKHLGKDSAINTRLKTMKDLSEHLKSSKLEVNGVEKLWSCTQDMFLKECASDVRHAAFNFLQIVIETQSERIDVMKAQFFRFIKHHDNPQDLAQRIDLLRILTNNGKDVEHFEEEIGAFLLNWINDVNRVGKLQEYLIILDNVIKFDSPHLDESIMIGYVKHLCMLCCSSDQYPVVILCLQILGTVVAYSILPAESLPQFVGTLCRTVNVKCYCPASWKTMKNLLGTHLGHSTLYTMCRFLKEPNLKNDAGLMKGCVFYIHMALWDINSLHNLCCPPSSVLPSILLAVKCNHASVAYEVILGIQKLINKQGLELLAPTWDIILEILLDVIKQIESSPNEVPNNLTVVSLHEILNTIENLIEVGNYNGSIKQFFNVIHECAKDRPEASVLKLINHLSKNIRSTEIAWLQNLFNLLTVYFRPDMRTNVRLKVLNVLSDVIQLNAEYDDELIDRIVIPHMQNIANDDNVLVRSEVAKFLIGLSSDYNSNICMDMLDILEKLLLRPYDKMSEDNIPTNEAEFFDIHVLVPGLIDMFSKKIHRLPSIHAIKIHEMLVNFFEKQQQTSIFKNFNRSRVMILEYFLKMRADGMCRLGYPKHPTGELRFSAYICVTQKSTEIGISSPPPTSPSLSQHSSCKITYLSMEGAFKLILLYLEKEKDWEVLKVLLDKLPHMLRNKPVVLAKHGNCELNRLVSILCNMLQGGIATLHESTVKVPRMEFQTAVVSVIVSLSSYSNSLDQLHQQLLINALTRNTGTDPRCSKQSINALTICMVDMRDTMMKLLPDVLLRLSKISATNYIAMPILEFLSTLSQLPTVYGNFVGDQYMAVFAIALPYTNPFKYDHYVVSLAYHVISVWFLKCRLPFRKDFVKFIVSGLQTNVLVPFQELNQFKLSLSAMNQDSSDRKRSSSLTEPGSRRRVKLDTTTTNTFIQKTSRDKTVLTFYEELNETCIDLMARYTYSPCSALPTRLPAAEFLLNGGITKSWMLGNKLITITTSGCTEKVLKHGVCDKCWSLCSSHNNSKIARYARSNSGNEDKDYFLNKQVPLDKSNLEETKKPDSGTFKLLNEDKRDPLICACWCQGWAEILIRRATGNISWVMKVQNQVSFKQMIYEFPLNEISCLYLPDLYFEPNSAISIEEKEESENTEDQSSRPVSVPGSPTKQSLSRQSSRDSADEELDVIYDDGTKCRNPVRRSNSSPEMANWKNPILHQKQERDSSEINVEDEDIIKKSKKDIRVSCEAIPEEISGTGTSPPSLQAHLPRSSREHLKHPSLLSCHSYPGSSPPECSTSSKPYKTVPASPNQVVSEEPLSLQSKNDNENNKSLDRPNNLPNLNSLPPLSSKPPQSPTQTSPRPQRRLTDKDGTSIQKSSSSSKLEKSRAKALLEHNPVEKRERVHTVSVMSTSNRKTTPNKKVQKEIYKSGLNPSFVFLQLYHSACFGNATEKPIYVHSTSAIDRAISILDLMYPFEVHKIGVLYISEGQADKEAEILKNLHGSVRYMEFLQNLGTIIRLSDVNPKNVYLGGVDQNGSAGKFMYTHQDDLVMLAFHVATLMPNKENDPNCNFKKAHIGNDNVVIVYNNSGQEFDINTFKTQVTLAFIIVEPLDYNSNKVEVKVKSDLKSVVSNEIITVSDQSVSILVRQLAVHADLAATVLNSLRSHATDPYASNWLERLRKLKNLREKVVQEIKKRKDAQKGFSEEKDIVEDFTDFT